MPNAHIPELLAPAGGMEQLEYALYFGADAVYLGCDKFGLRERAANFSLEELPIAVAKAHEAGAKVYVTLNAYAHDTDLEELASYVRAIAAAGADAAIVSDLGVLSVVKQNAPELAIHVSTQASVSNAAAARVYYELGARRIVAARELSLEELAALKRELPEDMELEVFVHGAMCMAISGRCLISDYLADRPANRGNCSQPCRWEYALVEPTRPGERFDIEQEGQMSHLLSSKDLNMIAHLDALKEARIDSIKIEGRGKKAFYVATVVNAYRQVLNGALWQEWADELDTISHRPYSTGFFFGPASQAAEDDSYTQLCDWVADVLSCEEVGPRRWSVAVRCRNRFYEGDTLEVLSPHYTPWHVTVEGLEEIVPGEGGDAPRCERVECAKKAMGSYRFTVDIPLYERDILRVKRKDPKQKN